MVLTTSLTYVPNSGYIYSDLGADLLGRITSPRAKDSSSTGAFSNRSACATRSIARPIQFAIALHQLK